MDNRELSREEIFEHIERDLLSSSHQGAKLVVRRTKGNYVMAFLINVFLLFLVLVGGIVVYLRFQATEYELVGSPQSIRGLEEALYRELQKRISQDLAAKEAELSSTKARLEEIQQRMGTYREELQQNFATELANRRRELEERLAESLRTATVAERQRLLDQHEAERRALVQSVQQEQARREQEYRQSLLREQQQLMSQTSNQQALLESTRRELSSAQADHEARLRAVQQESQQALDVLRVQLEGRQREEVFRSQIEATFATAMRLIRGGNHEEAQQQLQQISNLYSAKPRDIRVPPAREALDRFFVAALQDYIRLRQAGVVQEVPSVSLAQLRTLSEALDRGAYDRNPQQFEAEMRGMARNLPEVFAFYTEYQEFLGRMQNTALRRALREADNLFALRDYKAALLAYTEIAKQYPLAVQREDVFRKIADSISRWERTRQQLALENARVTNVVTNVVTNQVEGRAVADEREAARLFTNALRLYEMHPQRARNAFVEVIRNQPQSSYVPAALEYIRRIYQARFSQVGVEALRRQQEAEAGILYANAERAREQGEYERAIQLYRDVILKTPLSSYVSKSVEGLDRVYHRLLLGRRPFSEVEPLVRARVMVVEGNMLTLSVVRDQNLTQGQALKIYRRMSATEVEEMGRATVSRVNQVIVQAVVNEVFAEIRSGDLVIGTGQ